jgi:hypothetical protein
LNQAKVLHRPTAKALGLDVPPTFTCARRRGERSKIRTYSIIEGGFRYIGLEKILRGIRPNQITGRNCNMAIFFCFLPLPTLSAVRQKPPFKPAESGPELRSTGLFAFISLSCAVADVAYRAQGRVRSSTQ